MFNIKNKGEEANNLNITNNNKSKKVREHEKICDLLTAVYEKKNNDYGNSFGKVFREEGFTSVITRLKDKIYRLSSINKSGNIMVKDESVEDTLLDLANYCIMALIELGDYKEDDDV